MSKLHVGVLVLVYLGAPIEKLAAICRVRNDHNMDGPGHSYKTQSFAGGYQITAKGKQIGDETEGEILARETLEEIGVLAAYELLSTGKKFAPRLLFSFDEGEITHRTYVAYRPSLFYKLIQMDISGTPKLVFENELPLIEVLDPKLDKKGVAPGKIKFFADELKALRMAFQDANVIGIQRLMPHFNRRMIMHPHLLPDLQGGILPVGT